jgi:hypothetical protein
MKVQAGCSCSSGTMRKWIILSRSGHFTSQDRKPGPLGKRLGGPQRRYKRHVSAGNQMTFLERPARI